MKVSDSARPWILDDVNRRIVNVLAHNGRSAVQDIARAVGRTESAVRDRMASMEFRGVVRAYQARIDWAQAGLPLLLAVNAQCPSGDYDAAAVFLHGVPNVMQAVMTTGPSDILILARVAGLPDATKLLVSLSRPPLANVEVRATLRHLVERRPPVDGPTALDLERARAAMPAFVRRPRHAEPRGPSWFGSPAAPAGNAANR